MIQTQSLEPNNYLTVPISCPQVFSPEECARIISLPFKVSSEGLIHKVGEDTPVLDSSIRKTTCHFVEVIPENRWITQRVHELVEYTNQTYFHFRLSYLSQLQVMEYGIDGFYGWHMDIGQDKTSTRKLSFVIFLNPAAAYSGGRLVIQPHRYVLPQDQGTSVIFSSYLTHQVEPVVSGQRWTLVGWAHGPSFS
ncbi:MAG: 2OG-Fe(II) oxygenase [Candidatus Sericytochromatia bacterium]